MDAPSHASTPTLPASKEDLVYWHELVDQDAAARFLGLVSRTLQKFRQHGTGPRYVAISPRCVRYRRVDLRTWAEERLRSSTRKVESDL